MKVVVHLKNPVLNSNGSISVIISLIEFTGAYDISHIDEGAALWLFREFINCSTHATKKAWLTMSTNYKKQS